MRLSIRGLIMAFAVAGLLVGLSCESTRHGGYADVNNTQTEDSVSTLNNKGQRATYVSDKGKRLTAYFDTKAHTVTVKLPTGKVATLPLAISASGARYSNDIETFWEHHGEASYWIGGELIFRGKIER
ncbi:MAG: MliC family protein [Pseudomonadota bacterium]